MSEENQGATPEPEQPIDLGEQMAKRRNKIGCAIAAVLLLAASPFVYAFVMFSAEGIGNSMANKAASEISPEVQKLLPLNKAFLDAATAPSATAELPHFGEWMQDISWGSGLLGCPSQYKQENNSPDLCEFSTSDWKVAQTPKQVCTNVLAYAKKLGATNEISYLVAQGKPISESSVADCVKTLTSEAANYAVALNSPQFVFYGNFKPDTPMAIGVRHSEQTRQMAAGGVNAPTQAPYTGKQILQPLVDTYSITVATTFDQKTIQVDPSSFADGKNRTNALLDLIAFYRAANPQQDPRSKVFVDAVIDNFKKRYGFDDTWKSFVTPDKKVHWVQVIKKDGRQACFAIERKNSTDKNINMMHSENDSLGNGDFVGNGDITYGLPGYSTQPLMSGGKEIKSMNADYYFGDYLVGSCTHPTS